ncbi:hypothetical protein HDU79_003293 [Rhizoclosmatium sp. JEL0117]|nr:hypothetical protein HDU79_003293 [Rhizoclosmatium sp. JEL0117]
MKPALRKSIRQSLSALSQSTIETQSAQITKHVLAHPAYNAATRVSIYISKDNAPEVSTIALIRHSLSAGKQCFIPRCVSKTKMEMVRLHDVADLESLPFNKMGIREPALTEKREEAFDDGKGVDLVIMPLLAFDTEGWRLGHGGGYYDRFLAECEKAWGNEQSGSVARTIAIALKEQLVEESVPRDEYDKKPDIIIVADGEFSCRQ